MRAESLTRRAVAIVLLVELLCAVSFSVAALWHERRARLHSFDVMLQGRSDSLLGAVQDAEDPEDNVTIDPTELRLPSEDVYAVYNKGGRLLGQSPAAPEALTSRAGNGFSTRLFGGHEYGVLQRDGLRVIDRAETAGAGLRRPITIVYAAPTRHMRHEIFEAARFYMLASLTILCLTAALLILLLRGLLTPIQQLAAEAAQVTPVSLTFRPPAGALRIRELKPLSEALQSTMERLRHAFEREQKFFGDAAHELKTAVSVVRSSVQVLSMQTRTPEEYRRGLDRILSDNERVEDLVARMLMLSRFEQSEPHSTEPIDLAASARTAILNLTSFAQERGVSLYAPSLRESPVWLTAERSQVLISNLVVNAVQHSPAGSTVEVSVRQADGPEPLAILEVCDSGCGVSADALPHVFERFFREDTSRSRETGGAGLGLAICKGIVEAAGGTIEMQSKPDVGTTVRASFRLA